MTPITEDWLKAHQFKWHQFDRQPNKHWLLWIGDCMGDYTCHEDLGVEVAPTGRNGEWFCWLRSDCDGHYHRFIHIRHIKYAGEGRRMSEVRIPSQLGRLQPKHTAMSDKELRAQAARLWHQVGTVMINPEWLDDGMDRQALIDLARMMYGRRAE